jgi:hypothetical protein
MFRTKSVRPLLRQDLLPWLANVVAFLAGGLGSD